MDLEFPKFRESNFRSPEPINPPVYDDTNVFVSQGSFAGSGTVDYYSPNEFIQFISYADSWKQLASYSARIIDLRESGILIEMIIDSETQHTEDRIFEEKMFEGIPRIVGQVLKVKCYERKNCQMIQITNGDGLVRIEDFPKVNFDKFLKNPLF